jgi:hypothetical protein
MLLQIEFEKIVTEALRDLDDNLMIDLGIQTSQLKMICKTCHIFNCGHCIDSCPHFDIWPAAKLLQTKSGITLMVESFVLGHNIDKGKLAGYVRAYKDGVQVGQKPVVITLPLAH